MRRTLVIGVAVAVTAALATPATAASSAPAAGPRDSYVVVMAADPLVRTEGKDALDTTKAKAKAKALKASHAKALKGAGVSASKQVNEYTVALNGFSAILTADEAAAVERQPGVAFVAKDVFRKKTTDASPTFLGLNAPGGPWLKGYTGEGVVVGVIDSGIWPEHPSFADDGSYPSLGITLDETDRSACDFGNTAANPNDAPFTCNDKLLGARQMLDTYRALTG
ncbi:MAG: S8 family serine peptidase, partial [Actinomycetia bacterium]|nr:S8 family serine peptidase [Actinomycetes bacterium]